jgi:hypothetical protein
MGVFFVMMHPKILERCMNTVLKRTKYGAVVFDITYVQVLIITLLNVINWILLGIAFFPFINSARALHNSHKLSTDDCFRLKVLLIVLKKLTKAHRKVILTI